MADPSTMISSVGHCCNTETPHLTETVYPPHKSFMDILSKTYYQPIADPLLKNGKTRLKQQNKKRTKHYNPLKHTTINMHSISQKYRWDPTLPSTMLKQNSGIFMGL